MGVRARLNFFLLPFLLLLMQGCSGSGPLGTPGSGATAPAPLAEIPAFLEFPKNLAIDVEQVGASAGEGLGSFISLGDDISEAIGAGARFSIIAVQISSTILDRLRDVRVPVDPERTTFHGFVVVDDELLEIKIDFRKFDFNGDGIIEECTGCTCPAGCDLDECPEEVLLSELKQICYRVWIRERAPDDERGPFQRFLAGVMDRLPIQDNPETPPIEENSGNGQFRFEVSLPFPLLSPEAGHFSVTSNAVNYEHLDPEDSLKKLTELSQFNERRRFGIPVEDTQNSQHIKTEQAALREITPDAPLLKTIRATTLQENGEEIQYLARFRGDEDYWSGSITSSDPDFDFNFESACAFIPNGQVVEQENCLSRGIDVNAAGLPFLDFIELNEVIFPDVSQFPVNPTF